MSEQLGGFTFAGDQVTGPVELRSARQDSTAPEKLLRFTPGDSEFEVRGYTANEVEALLTVYRDHMEKFVAWMDTPSVQSHRSGPYDGWGGRA